MKNLLNQIKEIFFLGSGRITTVKDGKALAFFAHNNHEFIAAIPFPNRIEIYEDFVGFIVEDTYINVDGFAMDGLCLRAKDSIDINKFAKVAEDFVCKENRKAILDDPFSWIDGWKGIFGDTSSTKMIYDVIGEMIALKYVFSKDKTYIWQGPLGGTHDIVGTNSIVEVKTTKLKTDSKVEINSSYQLSIEKKTSLFFVRLEKKPYCLTINSLANDLESMGYDAKQLEHCLEKSGYKKGSRKREESYDLLSVKSFPINKSNFPLFSLVDINEFAPHKNIISYRIGIDLLSCDCEIIYEKE